MIRVLLNGTVYPENYLSWQERKEVISRSEIFKGVIITQSMELQFIGAACDYIIMLDDESDIAAECTIDIQYHKQIEGWVTGFAGYLDFKTLKIDTKDVKKCTISAYDSGFANKLLERVEMEVPYDRLTTVDGAIITPFFDEYKTVNIDGIEVLSTNLITINEILTGVNANVIFPQMTNSSLLAGWLATSLLFADGISGSFLAPSEEWVELRAFFKPINYRGIMRGTFNVSWKNGSQANNSFRILDYNDSLTPILVAGDSGILSDSGGEGTYTFNIDYTFDSNTRLVFYWGCNNEFTEIRETACDIELISIADVTPCEFVPPFEAFTRTIEAITDEPLAVESELFGRPDSPIAYPEDGEASLIFTTNGKLIRQFPKSFNVEKASQLSFKLKDLFENISKVIPIGAGIVNGKFYIDKLENFFNTDIAITIDRGDIELDSFEKSKDLTMYCNEIEVGSVYEQPEEVSGLEEYNSVQKYAAPPLHENKYDLLSTYIYAAYPYEFARRKKYIDQETEDYRYDNNIFLFKAYRTESGFKQHSDEDFTTITGLDNITTYINLELTPKRNLLRHGWYINSGLKGYQNKSLTYNKSDIVTDLATQKNSESEAIQECSDVLINKLDSPKFTGKTVKFNAPVSFELFDILKNNPYSLIKFYDPIKNDYGFGWIKEVSSSIIDKTTNWELYETTGVTGSDSYRLLQDGNLRLLEDEGIRLLE